MELKTVTYDVANRVATITLNRPERRNAWTGRMHTEYRWSMQQADRDDQVGAILVTGAGNVFCVGADARALEGHVAKGGYDPGTPQQMPEPGYGVRDEFDASFAWHFGLSKPVIAAINGAAAGVGLVIACYADIRFSVPGAKLTTAHGKLNLPAEFGLSWLLPRMIGLPRANELLLTSRVFMTDEAFELGLINRIVAPEQLVAEATAWAEHLVETVAPGSLATTRRQIYTDLHRDIGTSASESEALVNTMMGEPDYQEAVAAFIEKRAPDWHRAGARQHKNKDN
mgnify:FL=1